MISGLPGGRFGGVRRGGGRSSFDSHATFGFMRRFGVSLGCFDSWLAMGEVQGLFALLSFAAG